ncbi:hypothetical protein NON20_13270 [Synechocystis sp. B12]|nr:hypothetical protein NON20_13270 [Synechocystis sp. B12]
MIEHRPRNFCGGKIPRQPSEAQKGNPLAQGQEGPLHNTLSIYRRSPGELWPRLLDLKHPAIAGSRRPQY